MGKKISILSFSQYYDSQANVTIKMGFIDGLLTDVIRRYDEKSVSNLQILRCPACINQIDVNMEITLSYGSTFELPCPYCNVKLRYL